MDKEEKKVTTDAAEKFDAEKIVNESTAETVKMVLEAMHEETEKLKKENELLRDLKNYELEARLKLEKKVNAIRTLFDTLFDFHGI